MVATSRLHKKFAIDKRLIAINFDEIALIESALFNPKPINILALKKHFRIPLNRQQILQDWNSPYSLLRKWFIAILMSEISRCLFIEREVFNNLMAVWHKQAVFRDFIALLKAKVQHLKTKQILTHRQKVEGLNHLFTEHLTKPYTLQQLEPLTHYILQGARSNALKYYLKYAKNEQEARVIFQLLEQRFQMAEHNLNRLETIISDPTITVEQKLKAEEIRERYVERFKPENIEITQRVHEPLIDLNDAVVLEQYLKSAKVREEIHSKDIEGLQFSNKDTLDQSSDKKVTNELPQVRKTLKQTSLIKNKMKVKNDDKIWKLNIFQQRLNDALGNLCADKEILTSGVANVLDLQNSLAKAIKNPCPENLEVVNKRVQELVESFSTDSGFEVIKKCIENWSKQNNDQSVEKILLDTIKDISKSEDLPKEALEAINNFYTYCKSELSSDKGNEITNCFNQLVTDFPDLIELHLIRDKLLALSFIKEFDLKKPEANESLSLDF